mmetsp:Transcript_13623/g.17642  ORF Transcript_13623/g.17642 Transcript_13623/m.17642 type:complete len:127 (-) Transcript_13623:335-715(-)
MSRSRSPAPDKFGAIKRSLQHAVGEIAQHENRTNNQLPISGAGVATLTEVVFKYIESVASDLRSFSKHGKRATVTCDDVKLIARKVPELLTVIIISLSLFFNSQICILKLTSHHRGVNLLFVCLRI